MDNKKEYKQLLHDAGLKATPARLRVLNIMSLKHKLINIKELHKKTPCVNIVTLYRIMDIFLQKGIVRQVYVGGRGQFFELTALPHHHHIVCKQCGVIETIDECELLHMIEDIEKNSKKFQKISEHTFELFGLCEKCSSRSINENRNFCDKK
jgi:Fe2+ or Zn2+ uptake regulation protein